MNYGITLAAYGKINFRHYRLMLDYFLSAENIKNAPLAELINSGLKKTTAEDFVQWRADNPEEKILETMEKTNVKAVCLNEDGYPPLLREINDPPLALFYRGSLKSLQLRLPTIAVVGSRKCSQYGSQTCQKIINELSEQGLIVISGLALGIDAIAHQSCLEKQGKTVAVLGGGVDRQTVSPRFNYNLSEKIIEQDGALVSEYPPFFMPTAYTFPARNRIIAGLSLGTLVIEAAEKSGALITARLSLDYNREVMAIPHPVDSSSGQGTNKLIKDGAALIAEPDDVLKILNLEISSGKNEPFGEINLEDETEKKVYNALDRTPKHIDEIAKSIGLDGPTVSGTLSVLEIKGAVKNRGGMTYTI